MKVAVFVIAIAMMVAWGSVVDTASSAASTAWGTKCSKPKDASAHGKTSSGSDVKSYGRVCIRRWNGGSKYLTWGSKPFITTPTPNVISTEFNTRVTKGPVLTAVKWKRMVYWTADGGNFTKHYGPKKPHRLVWTYVIKACEVHSGGNCFRYDYKSIYDAALGTRVCRISPNPKCWGWKAWS